MRAARPLPICRVGFEAMADPTLRDLDGHALHGFSSIVYQPCLRLRTDETEQVARLPVVVVVPFGSGLAVAIGVSVEISAAARENARPPRDRRTNSVDRRHPDSSPGKKRIAPSLW